MKKILLKTLLLFAVLLSACTTNAQWQNGLWVGKQAYNWYLPKNTGLNFDTSPPTPLLDGQISGLEDANVGLASMSDPNGNLLFYTDGYTVWNKNHAIMLNGEGLLGSVDIIDGIEYPGNTTALIVPKPGSSTTFYIFVVDIRTGATFSEIDMSLDNGLGGVTSNKNQVLLYPNYNREPGEEMYHPLDDKIAAVYDSDGENIWVTFRAALLGYNEYNDNGEIVNYGEETATYYSFLVTNVGLNSPVISTLSPRVWGVYSPVGQMKFSPDGTKLARVMFMQENSIPTYAEVLHFNNATGEITEPFVRIPVALLIDVNFDYAGLMGCEFSPNGRYIYILTALTNKVYQFDLLAGNEQAILDSATLLYELNNTENKFYNQMRLGPDGKIYISNNLKQQLHVINYPNNAGVAAGFAANSVDLGGRASGYGLPNYIASYFESGILHEGECALQDVTFSTLRIPGIESIVWNFGDTASGAENTSTDLQPAHTFATPGTYTVTAVITSNGAQQTATTQVVIVPGAAATAPQGDSLIQCADATGNATFNLNQFNSAILNGQDADNLTITYYASQADMESGTPISSPASFVTPGQALYVKVVNTATQCSATTTFTLIVNPMPTATAPSVLEECADNTGEGIFDLTQQNADILGNQDPALFTVDYYANEQDMQNNSAIAAPDAFGSSGQTIYAVVNAVAGSNCIATTQFDVYAVPLPELPATVEFAGCSPFDLLAITAQQGRDAGLSFYTTQEDAQDGTNAIADVTRYIVPGNRALLYVAATNAQGCKNIGELRLEEGDCFIPRGISPNNDGLNDHFDLSGFDVNQLSIFNRYGQQVFSKANYTDQWHGQTDNNNELPTGAYYYYIKTNTGEQKTGWVYINREMN
jgi:gliding motility-associated-like protein